MQGGSFFPGLKKKEKKKRYDDRRLTNSYIFDATRDDEQHLGDFNTYRKNTNSGGEGCFSVAMGNR